MPMCHRVYVLKGDSRTQPHPSWIRPDAQVRRSRSRPGAKGTYELRGAPVQDVQGTEDQTLTGARK